jgi:hypothetical protein
MDGWERGVMGKHGMIVRPAGSSQAEADGSHARLNDFSFVEDSGGGCGDREEQARQRSAAASQVK